MIDATATTDRFSFWFVVTGAGSLAEARDRVLATLKTTQTHVRTQRACGRITDETVEANVRSLALCARWNRDFPHRQIPRQEPLW